MRKRRIRVAGRQAHVVGVIAAAGAVSVVVAGPSPTGRTATDVVLVGAASAAVIWTAASAPWWAGAGAAVAAGALAITEPLLVVVAAAAVGVALWIRSQRHSLPIARAVVAALTLSVLAHLGAVGPFGGSAVMGVGVAAALGIAGLARRSRRVRRRAYVVLAAVGGAAIAVLLGFSLSLASARPDLETGNQQAKLGLSQLGAGDFDGARASFASARAAFERADRDLHRIWSQPARILPVVAQHRRASQELAAGAVRAARSIDESLGEVRLESLRMKGGRLDIAAIEALEAPLTKMNAAIDDLDSTVAGIDSPWLVAPLQRRLRSLTADLAEQRVKGANALRAVQEAPGLLGRTEPRHYFVAFTTPAEARGLGGFMGNYAELTITDGRIEMTAFGRHDDLNEAGDPAAKRLTGPADFLQRWGRFGFNQPPDGRVSNTAWSDLTLDPHFPNVAQVIAQLYPLSGGRQVDGVFAMDVYTLAAVLRLTGPVEVPGVAEPLSADKAAQYLLSDQYALADNDERVDRLADVAHATVDRLLSGELPAPPDIARLLGPLAAEGRLLAWSRRESEQTLFTSIHMDGGLPALDGGDGLSYSLNNSVGNKIDVFLKGAVRYRATPDVTNGTVTAEADFTITNAAPDSGLPKVVIDNIVDLPVGTNRTYFTVYSALPVTELTIDGQTVEFETATEAGWVATSLFITWAPGETHTIVAKFNGTLDLSSGYHFVLRNAPVVGAFTADVEIVGPTPRTLHTERSGRFELDASWAG